MSHPEYHFVTRWCVEAKCEEVYRILDDPAALPRWWPAVHLAAEEVERGDEHGLGRRVRLRTKGWLPYTLRWELVAAEKVPWRRLGLQARGDFVGRGVWALAADGPRLEVTFDWRVRVEKPLLRRLTWLLRPVFAANHRWAMARGEESLRLELARRRAGAGEGRRHVPPPPHPARTSPLLFLIAAVAVLLALAGLAYGVARLW